MKLCGKRVLVTGGTGFIGGRLIEKLVVECGAKVRVLIRNFAHAARIGRLPLDMMPGDVTDTDAVRRAAVGCEVIFHCAYGNSGTSEQQRLVNVEGTRAVALVALAVRASRLVHVSSLAVYGHPPPDGHIDETTSRQRSGDTYADTKLEAEELVLDLHRKHGLPAVIIQPTIVYGPFSQNWTMGPLEQLKKERVVLVGGGSGLCNAVYVDDVVQALLIAATAEKVVGETFLVSGETPVTWRDFYGAYERMLGFESTVSMSAEEVCERLKSRRKAKTTVQQILRAVRNKRRRILQLPAVGATYSVARKLIPGPVFNAAKDMLFEDNGHSETDEPGQEKPLRLPRDAVAVAYFQREPRVCMDKARRVLDYRPCFDLKRGMEVTEKWAEWSNLL